MTSRMHQPELDPKEKSRRYHAILVAAERELDARTHRRRVALAGGGGLAVLSAIFITWLIGPLEKSSGPGTVFLPEPNHRPVHSGWISDSVASGAWLESGAAHGDWLIQSAAALPSDKEWLASDEDLDELMAMTPQMDERGVVRIGTRGGPGRIVLPRDLDRDLARAAQESQPDPHDPQPDSQTDIEPQ